MTNQTLLGGIVWHLECMVLAKSEIDGFKPPANTFQMRMYYSLYLTNLLSLIDMMRDEYGEDLQSKLESAVQTPQFSGQCILGYLRELRNGVVHRGIDPTSGGMVIDDVVCAISPSVVESVKGTRKYNAPSALLRDVLYHCGKHAKSVTRQFIESILEEQESIDPKFMLVDALRAIDVAAHMPDWAKQMSREHIGPDMLQQVQAHRLSKVRELLK